MTIANIDPQRQFRGPHYGLNATHEPQALGWNWAAEARNVILSDQRIRPRGPWRAYQKPAGTNFEDYVITNNAHVLSMFPWDPGGRFDENRPRLLVKLVSSVGAGELWAIRDNADPVQLATQMERSAANFVLFNGLVYVLDGGERIYRTDGTTTGTKRSGISPPTNQVTVTPTNSPGAINAIVMYAVTFYDPTTGVESNAQYFTNNGNGYDYRTGQDMAGWSTDFAVDGTQMPAAEGATHFRIYRRNVTLGQVAYRLIGEAQPGNTLYHVSDVAPESLIDESTDVDGPFAPSRNGIMKFASCGAIRDQRLWVNDRSRTGIVRFSAIGEPDHIDPLDFIDVSGDAVDDVNGLAGSAEQLVIGKPRNIWIMTGSVATPTNKSAALGVPPDEGTENTYRSQSAIGPDNVEGNGLVMAGSPARIMFPNQSGFYVFDGVNSACLSDHIRDIWRRFSSRLYRITQDNTNRQVWGRSFTFADDQRERVLYIANPQIDPIMLEMGYEKPFQLCYHYGTPTPSGAGAWTTFDGGDQQIQTAQSLYNVTPSAVCDFLTTRSANAELLDDVARRDELPPGIVVGTAEGIILETDLTSPAGFVPNFRFESMPFQPIAGGRVHVYFFRVLLALSDYADEARPAIAVVSIVDVRPGKPPTEQARNTLAINTFGRTEYTMPIRRPAQRLSVAVEKILNWISGYDESMGVVGWEYATEKLIQN